MFVIAEFLSEKDLIEVIPKVWLFHDTHTYWPPRKQSKDASQLIKRQIGPGNTWPIYPINIMGTAATYEEARHKVAKAKNGDGKLTSDADDYGRGKRNKRSFEGSSDEEEPNKRMEKIMKSIPKLPSSSQTLPSPSLTLPSPSLTLPSPSLTLPSPSLTLPSLSLTGCNSVDVEEGVLEEECSESLLKDVCLSNLQVHTEEQTSQPLFNSRTSTPKQSVKHKKKDALELILRNQRYMQLEMRELKEAVDRLTNQNLNAAASTSNNENAPDFGNFPLTDESSLQSLEDMLQSPENQVYFVRKLRSYGGSMYQDHVRRVLRCLFSNELAEQYNWLGSGNKKRFASLTVCQLIVDAVCEEQKTSRAAIEDIIKTWLRHAKERKNYVKKRDNTM